MLLSGCIERRKAKQLEAVARDWCLTIRASQVIPVYPLTEDLQPGDVFLVLESIPNQHRQYKQKGFLPLDQHMTRLLGIDYAVPYQKSYGIEDHKNTPHHWQFPDGADDPGWDEAPRAAFPTYTFSVEAGGGAKVAIPTSSVPIGLSMMKSGKASGSVSITDTYTYGVPFDQLVDEVTDWAGKPENREMLRGIQASNETQPIYLRVVSRVYLTGSIVVSLTTEEAGGARADAGASQDSDIPRLNTGAPVADAVNAETAGADSGGSGEPQPEAEPTVAAYTSALASISKAIDATNVGGSVKLAWASNRGVALSETFDRPLAIGYLGLDFPVLEDGALGTPIATRNQILDQKLPTTRLERESYLLVRGNVEALENATRDRVYQGAAEELGSVFEADFESATAEGDSAPGAFARAKTKYLFGKNITRALRDITNALREVYRQVSSEE